MSEEEPRTSRFRRSSRFRTPKSPPSISEAPKDLEAGAVTPPTPAAPYAALGAPPVVEKPVAPPVVKAPAVAEVPNILTVDVKEWFQTSACSSAVKFSHWSKYERRVERGIHMILAMLRQHDIKATFFVLGIVAREFPEMVRMIYNEGHEIGTMGYYNRIIHTIPPKEYIKELEMSISLLRSLINSNIIIHRAPEWSITTHTLWVFEVLKTYGIKFDSSIYPINAPLFGIENAPRFPYIINPSGIIEFPPSTYNLAGKNIALFGGTYLRILPYKFVSMGIENLNRSNHPVIVHISPWEIEAEFPKLNLGWNGYLSQYAGIKSTFPRLSKMLQEFRFDTLTKVLEELPPQDSVHISTLGKKGAGPSFEPQMMP